MFGNFIAKRTALAVLNLALTFTGFWDRTEWHRMARGILHLMRDSLVEIETGKTSPDQMLAAWEAWGNEGKQSGVA